MIELLNKFEIKFDTEGKTVISKENLLKLISFNHDTQVYKAQDSFASEFYLLIDRNGIDLYTFPIEDYNTWVQDGSLEIGDILYKATQIKNF